MTDPLETPTGIPGAGPARTALVPAEHPGDLDEETALAAVTAMRKHEIGVSIGAIAPPVLGVMLLKLAGMGMSVPWQMMAAVMAVCVATVPAILLSSRRTFLTECASLGISPPLARRLYRRVLRAQFRIERARPQAERDRELAAGLLLP